MCVCCRGKCFTFYYFCYYSPKVRSCFHWEDNGYCAYHIAAYNDKLFITNVEGRYISVLTTYGKKLNRFHLGGGSARGMAFDEHGLLYISSYWYNLIIIYTQTGQWIKSFDCPRPGALSIRKDKLYVSSDKYYSQIRVYTLNGVFLYDWKTGTRNPCAMTVINEYHEMFFTDADTNQLLVFSTQGNMLRKWGSEGKGNGQFIKPFGVAVYKDRVYVSDQSRLQIFNGTGKYIYSVSFKSKGKLGSLARMNTILYIIDATQKVHILEI